MTALELALDALAVARITRFVTRDKLGGVIRAPIIAMAYSAHGDGLTDDEAINMTVADWDRVVDSDNDPPTWAAFIICPWCVSVWASVGVLAARAICPGFWTVAARGLAFSQIAALLDTH